MREPKSYNIVLDDDPIVGQIIEQMTGVPTVAFYTLNELLAEAAHYQPLAAFVDIYLGTADLGLDGIPELRRLWPHVPILVVTSDDRDSVLQAALTSGANDFLRKPIRELELKARLQSRLFDLAEKEKTDILAYEDFTLNFQYNSITCNGKSLFIAPKDIEMLTTLIHAEGTCVSRDALRNRVWGKIKVSDKAVDKKVFEVRQILKELGSVARITSHYAKA